ncbi:hypothetical protein [Mycobacterium sp. AT1]|uniref:hypothetical protein n=1 Tax=Mycobacterium sp. AT1 TaxID=1961706 RepID=UPI0009ACDA26|nr:hypothetical protein [Mycobacterium sp. AT1]OPX11995.1 hypothetical protein B1790_06025 [Mycobacterium sp. AT1]
MALTLNDTQEAELIKLLGLPEAEPGEADTELVIDTVVDLAAQAEAFDPAKPSAVAAAARRSGMDLVDHDLHEALKRDAAAGRQAVAAAARQKVEASVDAAIDRGALAPARRGAWIELISADNAMADVLAKVPDHAVVPLSEIGHAATPSDIDRPVGWFY